MIGNLRNDVYHLIHIQAEGAIIPRDKIHESITYAHISDIDNVLEELINEGLIEGTAEKGYRLYQVHR